MKIFIPTYKRVGLQYTWKSLTPELREKTLLVCPTEEMHGHEKTIPSKNIMWQPTRITTISQKREWIAQQARNMGATKFLMLDDDLEFHARWLDAAENKVRLSKRGAIPSVINDFFSELEKKLDTYAHVGISARQTNSTQPGRDWIECQRMMYAFGYQTEVVLREVEFGRVKFREDFDYTLQLLRKGYKNVVGYDVCVDPKAYAAKGGCSEERTMESSNEEAEKLAALHPGFVKVKEMEYKTSLHRKEVTCYWKKAWESSQS